MDDNISLYPHEDYIERCGEIFLTTIGDVIFHCTLCEMKYRGFQKYADHVRMEHLFSVLVSQESKEILQFFDEDDKFSKKNSSYVVDNLETEDDFYIVDIKGEHIEMEEESIQENNTIVSIQYKETKTEKQQSDKERSQQESIFKSAASVTDSDSYEKQPITNTSISGGIRPLRKRVTFKNRTPMALRKHKCTICNAAFKDKGNLAYHVQRHSNLKNHQCPECDKKFYTKTEVKTHMRTHTGLRPFLCSECGRTFQTNSHLVNHLKRHNNQRDFKCFECDMKFFERRRLRDHMDWHLDYRPYTCNVCKATFLRRKFLDEHMKIHENKREYKCELCAARYNQIYGLRSHVRKFHKSDSKNKPIKSVK